MKISAVIITFNEADNIRAACESVDWADEIVVVDSESSDATCEIASSCGARVVVNKWPGFATQKQFATDAAAMTGCSVSTRMRESRRNFALRSQRFGAKTNRNSPTVTASHAARSI
jgi:glycosyltransferase involved in cell wall biosynthesis